MAKELRVIIERMVEINDDTFEIIAPLFIRKKTQTETTQPSSFMFHPFLHCSNMQPNARSSFYGLAGWHTKADMMRAVYEGIVFGHLSQVEK